MDILGLMQNGDDYVFHLDAPREHPTERTTDLEGWIAALHPIAGVHLLGATNQKLSLKERPDVVEAFPGHPFVTGFYGVVGKQDIKAGVVKIGFKVNEFHRTATERLPPPPPFPHWYRKIPSYLRTYIARLGLRMAKKPHTLWNAALRLLLSEFREARGGSFRRMEGDRLLELFAEHFPDAVVVQIGANDGVSGDPLTRYFDSTRWSGVLVEPVPHLYEALVRKYQDRACLSFEQAAISDHDGVINLYRIQEKPGVTPEWYQQLATIDRSVLLKHRTLIPDIEERIIQESVPVLSLSKFLSKYALSRIDLLVIDTEGHDYCILRQLDFRRYHPIVVMFEHQHLASKDKEEAYLILRKNGYRWAETPEGDTIAWRFL